jgi:hypothetical protein
MRMTTSNSEEINDGPNEEELQCKKKQQKIL